MQAFFALILILTISPVLAAEITPITGKHCVITKSISLDDLANKSGIIFRGKFEDFSVVEENGLTVRKLAFRVIEPIRGLDQGSKKIVLKEWAKIRSPFSAAEIAKDLDYVFFFNTPSSKGLTSLNGMEQGLVEISSDNSLKFSKRLDLGAGYSKASAMSIRTNSMDVVSYEGLKKFCKVSQ